MPTRDEVLEKKRAIEKDLLRQPGVTGVDVGYKRVKGRETGELAIIVYVREKKNVPAAQRLPLDFDGIQSDVVEGESFSIEPAPASAAQLAPAATLIGGISIGPCARNETGTLGVIVTSKNKPTILSNFHILASAAKPKPDDTVSQPGPADGGDCPDTVAGRFRSGFLGQPQNVDAALATVVNRESEAYQVREIGNVSNTARARVGDVVRKYGRTTGLTTGTVVSVTFSTAIPAYPPFEPQVFLNQIRVQTNSPGKPFQAAGDSGAVLVNQDNKIVGLLFAAGGTGGTEGLANPIQDVEAALGVLF